MTRNYLDHNATAPVRPEVIAVVAEMLAKSGNASSVHREGRTILGQVERAREAVRRLVNAPVNGVVFNSGGTESICTAIHGIKGRVSEILVGAVEHVAVTSNAQATGLPTETIPVHKNGLYDLEWLSARMTFKAQDDRNVTLVCAMLANNETGVIQPINKIAEIVHRAGGLLLVDAAQAVGKIPVNFAMLGADMMTLTGHKFGGPLGVGALIVSPNFPLEPLFEGGGHEMNRRAGTTNAPGIVGLGQACDLSVDSLSRADEISILRDDIERAVMGAGCTIWGKDAERLPGTLCFSAPGFSAETQVMAMDLEGLAISSGSACSSGKVSKSHVLDAMGATKKEASCSVRISLGWNSTSNDVAAFKAAWLPAYERAKRKAA